MLTDRDIGRPCRREGRDPKNEKVRRRGCARGTTYCFETTP